MSGAFATDAARYFAAGANVLPIVPGTKKPPEGQTWKHWQGRRQTEDEFERLLDTYAVADVAIILGRGLRRAAGYRDRRAGG